MAKNWQRRRQKSSRKGTWEVEFGALPSSRGRRRKRSKSGHCCCCYNEPTACNPGHVPPFECRLVESAFSPATRVRTKNKELICPTVPALGSSTILAKGLVMMMKGNYAIAK